MDARNSAPAKILIATDSITDATLVKNLLNPEFDHIFLSTDPARVVADFEHHRPDVLVLAFNELEKSERYYLGLYRLSQAVHQHPHRTVILCGKDEVKRVYELCMKDYFDDYILFWPMTYDTSRLLMSVHYALRALSVPKADVPSAVEFATQARRLAGLESKLDQQMEQGARHIEASSRAMKQAEQEIGSALDGLSRRLIAEGQTDSGALKSPEGMINEIRRFKHEEIHPHLQAAAASTRPLKQWVQGVKQECAPQLESACILNAMAERIRPTVLVVDDDELQRKIIGEILGAENYRLIFAANGIQALSVLRKTQPDIIFMDIMMPEVDGMEVTRRLRTIGQLARTPVIMITGNSEPKIVLDCLKAGANDFVVKPFNREILLAKMVHALNPAAPPSQ